MGDWTTRVAISTPDGIVAVRNGKGRWGLPGGKKEIVRGDITWEDTGIREIFEETGLRILLRPFIGHEKHSNRRGSKNGRSTRYTLHYCIVTLSSTKLRKELKLRGNEGEEVRVIPRDELRRMMDSEFEPHHKAYLERFGLLKTEVH